MPMQAESTAKERAAFAVKLKARRRKRMLSQKEVAEVAGLSLPAYKLAEQGRSLGYKTRRLLEAWLMRAQ